MVLTRYLRQYGCGEAGGDLTSSLERDFDDEDDDQFRLGGYPRVQYNTVTGLLRSHVAALGVLKSEEK